MLVKVGAITMGKSIIDFINKILDTKKLIFRLWIVLWLCLLILLVLKFCFGIWYPIVSNNEILLRFNDFVCNSWIKYLALSIFYVLSMNLLYFISSTKKKYNNIIEAIIFNVLFIISFVVKCFSKYFSFIPEVILLIIIPIIELFKRHKNVNKFKIILYVIIMQIFVNLWQMNILLVRNIDFSIDENNHILIGIILQLDYYIFLIITWIGVSFMGLFSAWWFFGKDVTTLKAEREKEMSKEQPNMIKVNKIDERIKELEEKA